MASVKNMMPGVQDADVARALRQRRQRQHRERRERAPASRLPTVIAGNRNRLFCRNAKLPANSTCRSSSSIAGTSVTSSRNDEQHRQLAGDVLGPHQRLRQVDLQRVGAAIVGDQPGADVDRDEEDEEVLLLEELPEGLGRRREDRGLRIVRADVDLHGADDERHPREEQQPEEGPLPDAASGCRPTR